jgi:alpha-D-ribose 1-methylphosphonate 5-triphosphate synthase subunit PhnH
MSAALAPGFADPVFDAQAVFRVALIALSRPGIPRDLPGLVDPPAPLTPGLAALALALADGDAPLWLDASLSASAAVTRYLRFHTGARLVENPAEAAFALIANPAALPAFDAFAWGSDEYPDRSTTLLIAVEQLSPADDTDGIQLEGPGVNGRVAFSAAPLPPGFAASLRVNNGLFPRGLDCLLVSAGQVLGIPRSSKIVEIR